MSSSKSGAAGGPAAADPSREVPEGVDPVKHWRPRVLLYWMDILPIILTKMAGFIQSAKFGTPDGKVVDPKLQPYFRYYGGYALNVVLGRRIPSAKGDYDGDKGAYIRGGRSLGGIWASDIDVKIYGVPHELEYAVAADVLEQLDMPEITRFEDDEDIPWNHSHRSEPFNVKAALTRGEPPSRTIAVLLATKGYDESPFQAIVARLFPYGEAVIFGEGIPHIQIQIAALMRDTTFIPISEISFVQEPLPRDDPGEHLIEYPSLPVLLRQFRDLKASLNRNAAAPPGGVAANLLAASVAGQGVAAVPASSPVKRTPAGEAFIEAMRAKAAEAAAKAAAEAAAAPPPPPRAQSPTRTEKTARRIRAIEASIEENARAAAAAAAVAREQATAQLAAQQSLARMAALEAQGYGYPAAGYGQYAAPPLPPGPPPGPPQGPGWGYGYPPPPPPNTGFYGGPGSGRGSARGRGRGRGRGGYGGGGRRRTRRSSRRNRRA
jgi:hypothetical protein